MGRERVSDLLELHLFERRQQRLPGLLDDTAAVIRGGPPGQFTLLDHAEHAQCEQHGGRKENRNQEKGDLPRREHQTNRRPHDRRILAPATPRQCHGTVMRRRSCRVKWAQAPEARGCRLRISGGI